jgi:outer membrane biosynthesis protein TonB
VYPDQAIRSGISGDVLLQILTDEQGRVFKATPVEGDPLLVAASIEALKDFQFRPYLLNSVPISTESQIAFRFTIKGGGDKPKGSTEYSFNVPYRPEFRTGAVTSQGILVLSPRKISGPDPILPTALAGRSGSVYLTVTIGIDGKVEDVKVVGGDEAFVEPVVAAVKQQIFEPQLIDGRVTPAIVQASYHFGSNRE